MFDLVNNQEVQAGFIALFGAVLLVVSALVALLGIWIRGQGRRLEANDDANATKIKTNATDIANRVEAQSIIQADLKRLQLALEEAQKVSTALTIQNRELEKVQISYDSKVDQLNELLMNALERDAKKTVQIEELQRQNDIKTSLITDLQNKQSEMSIALGLKDEAIRRAEDEKGLLQGEILELRRQQVSDRDEIADLKKQINAQKLRLDELESLNKSRL
jgi:chromosome segregation ATPase